MKYWLFLLLSVTTQAKTIEFFFPSRFSFRTQVEIQTYPDRTALIRYTLKLHPEELQYLEFVAEDTSATTDEKKAAIWLIANARDAKPHFLSSPFYYQGAIAEAEKLSVNLLTKKVDLKNEESYCADSLYAKAQEHF